MEFGDKSWRITSRKLRVFIRVFVRLEAHRLHFPWVDPGTFHALTPTARIISWARSTWAKSFQYGKVIADAHHINIACGLSFHRIYHDLSWFIGAPSVACRHATIWYFWMELHLIPVNIGPKTNPLKWKTHEAYLVLHPSKWIQTLVTCGLTFSTSGVMTHLRNMSSSTISSILDQPRP